MLMASPLLPDGPIKGAGDFFRSRAQSRSSVLTADRTWALTLLSALDRELGVSPVLRKDLENRWAAEFGWETLRVIDQTRAAAGMMAVPQQSGGEKR